MTKANEERKKRMWKNCVEQLTKLNPAQLKEKLELILSPNERKLITLRTAALKLIAEGKSYNDIRRELGAGPQIISALKKGMRAKQYTSSWEKTKVDIEIKQQKKWTARQSRDESGISRKLKKFHSHLL